MSQNKVKKTLSPEESQMLENIKATITQLEQMTSAQSDKAEGSEGSEDAVLAALSKAGVQLTDDQKKVYMESTKAKKADGDAKDKKDEAKKANAEEAAGETAEGEDLQPGTKKAKKDEGSTGSDDAEKRAEDTTNISEEGISEVGKALQLLAKTVKSISDKQSGVEKAMEGLLVGLGIDKTMESIQKSEAAKPRPFANSAGSNDTVEVLKSFVESLTQAQSQKETLQKGNTSDDVRKGLGTVMTQLLTKGA